MLNVFDRGLNNYVSHIAVVGGLINHKAAILRIHPPDMGYFGVGVYAGLGRLLTRWNFKPQHHQHQR